MGWWDELRCAGLYSGCGVGARGGVVSWVRVALVGGGMGAGMRWYGGYKVRGGIEAGRDGIGGGLGWMFGQNTLQTGTVWARDRAGRPGSPRFWLYSIPS